MALLRTPARLLKLIETELIGRAASASPELLEPALLRTHMITDLGIEDRVREVLVIAELALLAMELAWVSTCWYRLYGSKFLLGMGFNTLGVYTRRYRLVFVLETREIDLTTGPTVAVASITARRARL